MTSATPWSTRVVLLPPAVAGRAPPTPDTIAGPLTAIVAAARWRTHIIGSADTGSRLYPLAGALPHTLGGHMDTACRSGSARCADLVNSLPIPNPFNVDLLLRRLGDQRGKTIRLFAAMLDPNAPCGVLVSTTTIDYICYAANTSPLHRQHIILHEIGHLVLDHAGHRITQTEHQPPALRSQTGTAHRVRPGLVEQLMPHLDPSGIRRLLTRSTYHVQDERDAELFATLAGDRVSRLVENPTGAAPRDVTAVRLRALFDIPAPRSGGDRG